MKLKIYFILIYNMVTKIIYPVIIIIFSILIIFAIINNKNNNKLNKGIEKFRGKYLDVYEEDLKVNARDNTENTKNIANGDWTYPKTVVNPSTKIVSNLINIFIDNMDTNKISNITNINYGKINMDNNIYIISMILNENIIGSLNSDSKKTIHIKFFNIYGKESTINLSSKFLNPLSYNAQISLFNNDTLLDKFISYKVFNNYASDELFRIITESNYYINEPPPLYDDLAYKIITGGSYKFPNNYIYFSNDTIVNPSASNSIKNKYFDQIQFSIIRIFYSPSGEEIRTQNSSPILLRISGLPNNTIPRILNILPFKEDQVINKLNTFFKPKATILYFYKKTKIDTTYSYLDPMLIYDSSSSLKLSKNNNSMNLYKPKVAYNKLNTVKKINNHIFTMTYFGINNSDLNNITQFDFNQISSLL